MTEDVKALQARIAELETQLASALNSEAALLNAALRESISAINSSLDPKTVMKRILETVGEVVPHQSANIMLIYDDIVRVEHWRGYAGETEAFISNFEFPLSQYKTLQYMLTEEKPLIVNDTQQHSDWEDAGATPDIRSYASAPIRIDNKIIGFLNLDSKHPNVFEERHADWLQIFANQAAIAIRNARVYDQLTRHADVLLQEVNQRAEVERRLEQRNKVLEALNQLANESFNHLEVSHILDTLARLSAEALDATSAYISDWDRTAGTSTVLADYVSQQASPKEQASDLGSVYPIYGDGALSDSWISDPRGYSISHLDDPDTPDNERQHLADYGGYIALNMPLRVRDEVIGLLEVWDSRDGRTFSENDIAILQALARQISNSLDVASLQSDLQQTQARNEAILSVIPDMMFRIGRDGEFRDCKVPFGSAIQPERLIGKSVYQMMPRDIADYGMGFVHEVLDSDDDNPIASVEYRMAMVGSPDERDFEARLVPSGPDEALAIVRDVTERNEMLRELAQARDEALKASRIKSQFLANISHELRTPLNSIINYTQLLENGIYGELNQTQLDRLDKVTRNGKHLLDIINDVLDLSKIEAGHMVLRRQRVNTLEFVSQIMETFTPLAEDKGLDLIFEGGNIPDLYVDEPRAAQVLNNIIGNAIKFTDSGKITLTTERQDAMLQFSITDTGIGISEEAQGQIFDEFRQADNSSTRQYDGTGLGLTLSQRIVQMHGGVINVASQEGVGSTFTVTFPVAEREEEAVG